ncbi:MAG: hypothetical protein JNJ88_10795 [Planctomycetes bacterium]|nr:hypothetical protein [Planctomycetota bacterium]
MSDPSLAKPRWSLRKKLLLQLALLPLELAAVELGFRGYLRWKGEFYSAWRTELEVRRILQALTSRLQTQEALGDKGLSVRKPVELVHPYAGFDIDQTAEIVTEETTSVKRGDSSYDILLFGGSVAGHFEAFGGTTFAQVLEADPRFQGKRVKLWLHARGGFKQPQHLTMMAYLLSAGIEPEAAVLLDGFNEVALSLQNTDFGGNPLFPTMAQWAPLLSSTYSDAGGVETLEGIRERQRNAKSTSELVLGWGLHNSAVIGTLARGRIVRMYNENYDATQKYLVSLMGSGSHPVFSGPKRPGTREGVVQQAARAWFESSLSMHAICAARGITFFHTLQPTLHDEGSKVVSEEETRTGSAPDSFRDGVRLGYPRLRALGEKLRVQGVSFYDGSRVFAGRTETFYYDNCHFNKEATEILAEEMAKQFLAALK